ncbi:hypothetical protein Q6269_30410, partial [Klebsiella pneumoniae]|nr:hypothetical protein [Klebsiella pneumoniae]
RSGDELLLSEPEPLPARHHERHERRPDRPPRERGRSNQAEAPSQEGLRSYRVEVGNVHGARTGNLVGAIANEANLDA